MKKKQFIFFYVLYIFCAFYSIGSSSLFCQSTKLSNSINVKELAGLLVYEQGRVKPLDTVAKNLLLRFSAKSTYKDEKGRISAITWFAQLAFDPYNTRDDIIFKVNNPEVLVALGVKSTARRFSFNDFIPSFSTMEKIAEAIWQKEEKIKEQTGKDYQRNSFEKEFMRVYQNLNDYYAYSLSFEYALPLPLFEITSPQLKKELGLSEQRSQFSYLDLMEKLKLLKVYAESLRDKNEKNFNDIDKEKAKLVARYFTYPQSFKDNPIYILPSFSHEKAMWISPWQVLSFGSSINLVKNEFKYLKLMAEGYRLNDQSKFDNAVNGFKSQINKRLEGNYDLSRPAAELFYNQLDPFYRAKISYGLAMLLVILSLVLWKKGIVHYLKKGAFFLLTLALGFNIAGIGLRMYINARPPITNLFETFIFVAAVTVILSFFVERISKKGLGVLSGSFSGLVLLLISGRFGSDGDTIQVMQAVLDSNFWLATHVVTINLGYAGVVIAGVIGHFYLFEKLKRKSNTEDLKNITKAIYGTLAFGFVFVFTGTVLGGIWADQSWGRFWGWDPKENGALLIILWCLILFHSRVAGLVRELFFSAGTIFGIVVVMWAWFGINLLGVGLHSYGFIDGVFNALVLYTFGQSALVFSLLAVIVGREEKLKEHHLKH